MASPSAKSALSAHSAIGLVVGALLYIVCVTGTLSVFYPELQRLEQVSAPEMSQIDPAAAQRGMEAVLEKEQAQGLAPTTHLYIHIPTEDLPRATISTDTQAFHLDASGAIAMPEQIAWSDFLIALHYKLSLPNFWGLTLVGALGAMLLASAFTGVLALPRIFRDAFRLNARSANTALADWHNRLSTWTLPFSLAIAFTGAAIGLGGLGALVMGKTAYDGDSAAVYAPIFGEEMEGKETVDGPPDVAGPLAYVAERFPDLKPTYAIIHDPLQPGQHVQILGGYPRRLIFGEYYNFDQSGRFLGSAGLADGDLGQQAAASTYNLHFGNYGGLPVKIVYFILGMAVSVISATGFYIWLAKRRRRGHRDEALRASWHAVVWGCPAMILTTFAARIIIGNDAPFDAIFWTGQLLLVLVAALWAKRRTRCAPPRSDHLKTSAA
ncbi:PepSY-associated TM helix domain-containing protein [Novosphingopyxis iocasae]|uniref:PepSY-associated TM helix domain-containing protein n=1 Tax=Novosphingopyxis iocasae TaxID=2762729 RepID=UPI001650FA00|nr:PepSY-associated TM helix domain-containing protein [Novosphingopyxis iocasae]